MFLREVLLPSGWFVSGMRLDGRDIMATGFSVKPGVESTLEVIVTNRGGSVAGIVKDREDKTVSFSRLILVPEPALRANPMLFFTDVAGSDGEFTFNGIVPGQYTLIAFPDEDEFTAPFLRKLETIERYERFGEPIYVSAGQTVRANLAFVPID